MYVPAHFALPDAECLAILARVGGADLVTNGPDGLTATFLPLQHVPGEGLGSLTAHLARNNTQWQHTGEALVVAHETDHYVSPRWLPSAQSGRTVPTWDYVTVHAYGELVVHDDADWLREHVTTLTDRHEQGIEQPWAVDEADPAFVTSMLRAIVGVEIRLTRVVGKAKMAQNKTPEDVAALAAAIDDADPAGAQYLREVSLPAARRRAQTLADVARRGAGGRSPGAAATGD